MTNEHCDSTDKYTQQYRELKCISWSAIIAGALIGVGLSFLFNLFSIAIGLSIVKTSKEGLISLAIGGFIGLAISTVVSMFVAGTAAGYLGRNYCLKRNLGVLYGFTTWCLALILASLLASQMGHYISRYSTFITNPTSIMTIHNKNIPTIYSSNTNNADMVTVNTQKATTDLGITSFLMFILFFISALASCFGGHYGMACDNVFCRKP